MYEWCGGLPALIRMARLFYGKHAPADPLLAPIFASMSADHPERVAKWLAEVFGGPRFYSREYGGYPRMVSQHLGRSLTEEWRARWVGLMAQSATEAGLPNDAEFRSAFVAYLEWGSHIAVENSQPNAQPPQRMPMPRWDWGTAGPPGTRISPPAQPTQEESAVLPALDEAVLFHQHVKPLFRTHDRRSMKFAFDLWSYDDVKAHAAAILHQISAGTMPCDRAWPAERVAVLRRWIDTGMPQ
jgi:truncated hemoglobin YjbI